VKAYKGEEGLTSHLRPEIVGPGANLVVVDLKPGGVSAMRRFVGLLWMVHRLIIRAAVDRTVSIDFSICVIGEIDHELDGGEKVRLQPGVSTP